jgi:hypothetical protein
MEAIMKFSCCCVAVSLGVCLIPFTFCEAGGPTAALGILTQARDAHVDEALAFPGLSVFEGEQLVTDQQGHIGVQVGHSVLTLAGSTSATVFHITDGIHVDVAAGSMYFNGSPGEVAEMHVGEAFLRTVGKEASQARLTILAPNVLQVTTQKGGLNFSYREEFRFLPEGMTYRIYLDAPAEPQMDAVDSAPKSGISGKVAYFIVGGAAGGAAVLGIHTIVEAGNPPISPAAP